jgi:hypothetical protein
VAFPRAPDRRVSLPDRRTSTIVVLLTGGGVTALIAGVAVALIYCCHL